MVLKNDDISLGRNGDKSAAANDKNSVANDIGSPLWEKVLCPLTSQRLCLSIKFHGHSYSECGRACLLWGCTTFPGFALGIRKLQASAGQVCGFFDHIVLSKFLAIFWTTCYQSFP